VGDHPAHHDNVPAKGPKRGQIVSLSMAHRPGIRRPSRLFSSVLPLTLADAVNGALAGLQLAAMDIPQVLGYTRIAGTTLVSGLYTLLWPPLAFAAFGSSRYLVVAADSATAAILAGGLAVMAPMASARYMALAAAVALMTAGMLLFARLLKLGFLADFLSQTVLVGFLTGVGVQVGIAVAGEMAGLDVHSRSSLGQVVEIAREPYRIHLLSTTISIAVIAGIPTMQRLAPKIPWQLVAVLLAIGASFSLGLEQRGVAVIGAVPAGLPRIALPSVTWTEIKALLPIAGSCFIMIIAQSAATARFYAMRHHERLNGDADLVGLCAANLVAGLSGAFVVDGSPTQTAMVESSGSRSQFAQICTSGAVSIVLLFAAGPLQWLPRCVLGAIVFLIAVSLIDIEGLRDIRRESPGEYLLALLTASVVVVVGVEEAIVLAMVLSLLRVLKHSYRPQTGVLVKQENGVWDMLPPRAGTVSQPGLVIYRFGAPLFYANANMFAEQIDELIGHEENGTRLLLIDSEAITNIDYTAARVVRELHRRPARDRVEIAFARVAPSLRADLQRHRLIDAIGADHVFARLHEALAAFGYHNLISDHQMG
jgi:SulP family sulfate permease